MKTNTFNYFRNAFALIGFFIIACSVGTADEPTVEPEPPVQSNIGKYQISAGDSGAFKVMNTETGQVKIFAHTGGQYSNNPVWTLVKTINTQ